MALADTVYDIGSPSHKLAMRSLKPLSGLGSDAYNEFWPAWTAINAHRRAEIAHAMVELAEAEYMVRSRGFLQSLEDFRTIPISVVGATPVLLRDVAFVQIGPEMRRGIAELDGEGEVAGGVVVMRSGKNARTTIEAVKAKLAALKTSLPPGVEVVTTYDRSLLIDRAVENLPSPAQLTDRAARGEPLTRAELGVLLAYALRLAPGIDARLHASGAQTAYRFNSFIVLALAERLAGAQGLAWAALLIGLCVPLCNAAAVWPLARHGGHGTLREIARNPLILSTVAGFAANLAGLRLPDAMATALQRLGLAALPLGLMAVGAGLKLGGLKAAPGLAGALLTIRHALLPLLAIGLCLWLPLPAAQGAVLVAFAAVPTASSAYVLAARMGGDASFVAGLVTVSTLLGALSLPLWLTLQASLQAP